MPMHLTEGNHGIRIGLDHRVQVAIRKWGISTARRIPLL